MLYALGYETLPSRPTKRRRLLTGANMAPRDGKEPQQGSSADAFRESQNYPQVLREHASQSTSQYGIRTSDREELIECIKRGQKPLWVPKPSLQALYAEDKSSRETGELQMEGQLSQSWQSRSQWLPTNATEDDSCVQSWADVSGPDQQVPQRSSPRPRSAFHTGDFRSSDGLRSTGPRGTDNDPFVNEHMPTQSSTSPAWLTAAHSASAVQSLSSPRISHGPAVASIGRQRAPSLGSSFSSCFIMRTPTSPLAHAITTSVHDLLPTEASITSAADRQSRRRTMPPNSFHSLHMSPLENPMTVSGGDSPRQILRRESTMPHYTHQPRRSLSSFTVQSSSGSHIPQLRSRRPSIASDSSSRRRTSMVGSFEESILRGRMSSPPSKPFDFVAQIGVMGKGECPPSLKCPAHVSVPFHAVFYSYPTSNIARTIADDAPSPYVGTVDLASNLKSVQLSTRRRRTSNTDSHTPSREADPTAPENTSIGKALARDALKQKRRSSSPNISIGGAYRVPRQGQLQIVIKNPNKTAVKLFLVPYDLEGMDPGTKTFVRQRSYTSGPILEGALGHKSVGATIMDPLKDKSILRYLVHLNFCCPAKNRYYLYGNIRVVFANRVPDGKEKLRNEVQLPEPKYGLYRPAKTSQGPSRWFGTDFSPIDPRLSSSPGYLDDILTMETPPTPSIPEERAELSGAIPFHLAANNDNRSSSSVHESDSTRDTLRFSNMSPMPPTSPQLERTLSPVQGFLPSTSARSSPVPWGSSSTSSTTRSFSPAPVEAGNGLLSRQFRRLNGLTDDSGAELG